MVLPKDILLSIIPKMFAPYGIFLQLFSAYIYIYIYWQGYFKLSKTINSRLNIKLCSNESLNIFLFRLHAAPFVGSERYPLTLWNGFLNVKQIALYTDRWTLVLDAHTHTRTVVLRCRLNNISPSP